MASEAGKVIDFKGFGGKKNLFTMLKNNGEKR